jgi:hypothetical protein
MEKQGRYIHYTAEGEKEYTINDYAYVVLNE